MERNLDAGSAGEVGGVIETVLYAGHDMAVIGKLIPDEKRGDSSSDQEDRSHWTTFRNYAGWSSPKPCLRILNVRRRAAANGVMTKNAIATLTMNDNKQNALGT
ncbi:hypothetical protein EN836_13000 [Mesorhizobium sp. M1C.F.Ca.ET.193.01.1.1]|uniref:hypothetical protein n=1 Tax=unclassified Mesorhizobium TaxID=325217 RepID=UPI000FD813D6|nr:MULTISPECIES: hypothetical protein [unclassified Mesorhizobium]TGS28240.1 hypothetical protein EN830_13010 [Mesorhizobium sp. M1C.F.Ca.ET.187.01.1.1]TGS74290.1 hypothetical protein EN819_13010 [Mesorhizobium sp. M1C.F.Ca.ET.176.01.1.1]TGT00571.1 hypothetical protein EN820_31730 [bacterium M00.F.Ca.ET.177.01.1.1]TGQ53986.1 hypothetical protein EN853_13000 [Mesorhizobium sp. M1C.F.Ca.ET.210.01.1.1]TGQ72007.1 hypothetical protein EN855_013010 [Mesorhizobium sp. M1C.F.Ca.ET.212.01.1.1]